jgi:hypothetical protein
VERGAALLLARALRALRARSTSQNPRIGARDFATKADNAVVKRLRLPVLLLAVLGAAALLASGCGGGPGELDLLASAAERTEDAGSARFELAMGMTMGGRAAEATATGAFDNASRRATMSMDLGGFAQAFGQAPGGPEALRMDMVLDGTVAYMRFPLVTAMLPGAKPWLRLDLVELSKREGLDLGQIQSFSDSDPRRTLDYLRVVSGEIRTVGQERVRGVATTHYRAAVDLRKYPDVVPDEQRELVRKATDKLVEQLGVGAVPVDVWVDGDGLVRRIALEFDSGAAAGASLATAVRMDLYDYGAPVDVALPAATEVTDLAALLPG